MEVPRESLIQRSESELNLFLLTISLLFFILFGRTILVCRFAKDLGVYASLGSHFIAQCMVTGQKFSSFSSIYEN